MKILLDDVKLTLLLEQKKQFIGTHIVWDSILSAASFLISVLLATYPIRNCTENRLRNARIDLYRKKHP